MKRLFRPDNGLLRLVNDVLSSPCAFRDLVMGEVVVAHDFADEPSWSGLHNGLDFGQPLLVWKVNCGCFLIHMRASSRLNVLDLPPFFSNGRLVERVHLWLDEFLVAQVERCEIFLCPDERLESRPSTWFEIHVCVQRNLSLFSFGERVLCSNTAVHSRH